MPEYWTNALRSLERSTAQLEQRVADERRKLERAPVRFAIGATGRSVDLPDPARLYDVLARRTEVDGGPDVPVSGLLSYSYLWSSDGAKAQVGAYEGEIPGWQDEWDDGLPIGAVEFWMMLAEAIAERSDIREEMFPFETFVGGSLTANAIFIEGKYVELLLLELIKSVKALFAIPSHFEPGPLGSPRAISHNYATWHQSKLLHGLTFR